MLPWEFQVFGHTLSLNVLIPGILLIPTMYGLAGLYPFLERWVTRAGSQEHHLLDRPRYAPGRTGLGMMALTFYVVLFLAGGNDIIALKLHLSLESITMTLRILLFVAPVTAAWVTRRVCLSLQRHDRDLVLHGRETGHLVRTAGPARARDRPPGPNSRRRILRSPRAALARPTLATGRRALLALSRRPRYGRE